jgi:hypothetical protein
VPAKPTRPRAAKGKRDQPLEPAATAARSSRVRAPLQRLRIEKDIRRSAPKVRGEEKAAGVRVSRKGEFVASGPRTAGVAGAAARKGKRITKASESFEVLSGRNSVLEALRAKIPATALYLASRIEMDDRVKEALTIAKPSKDSNQRGHTG